MNRIYILLFFLLLSIFNSAFGDTTFVENNIKLQTANGDIAGTITVPKNAGQMPIVIFVAGSGPVDRNGNLPMANNDGFKKLASALAENGIASLRYDKRGIGESAVAGGKEGDLKFEDYISDLSAWIDFTKKDKRFPKIIVAGHSEGSLIGMVASIEADGFISIAGAGEPVDKILKRQLSAQPQQIQDFSYPIIDSLKLGKRVENVNPMLFNLFRPSVQPYLISWMKYDPQSEIKKLTIPVLILQGTNDIQVTVDDANKLSTANPTARFVLIENMNHVFRIVEGESKEANLAAYNNPQLPIAEKLVSSIIGFVKEI